MKPFRAVALVVVAAAFWAGLRAADIREGVARRFEPLLQAPVAPLTTAPLGDPGLDPGIAGAPTPTTPYPRTPDPRTPEVQVYSYPGRGDAGPPAPMYRLRGRRLRETTTESERAPAPAALDFVNFAASPPRAAASVRAPVAAPAETQPDMRAAAYDAATRAYAYLRSGDRRAAASAFAVALSLAPDHPRAEAWRKEKTRLGRWWRAEAYVLQRGSDGTLIRSPGLPAASNVLGGGQAAALVAITPNPLGRVPVELFARYAVPQNGFTHADTRRSQAAIGIAVRPIPKIPITLVAERLFKTGSLARNDFQLRAYGGASRRVRGIDVNFFGETGVVGKRPDYFAGAQVIAEKPLKLPGKFDMALGVGGVGRDAT